MYEELIKDLRNVSEYDSGYAKLMYDAADAIEELSKRVPVPPHGRLIDADALLKDYENSFYRKAVVALMEDAPTVISEDKEG